MLQYLITKEGFGKAPGQLPPELKEPLMIFDHISLNDFNKKTQMNSLHREYPDKVPYNVRQQMKELLSANDYSYLNQQEKYYNQRKIPVANSKYRCPVAGFVPYDDKGKVINSAYADGVPTPYKNIVFNTSGKVARAPHILVLRMDGSFITALAFLFFNSNDSVKLEYLCAAPEFKRAGTTLLQSLPQQLRKLGDINYIYLDDDSGKKGRTNSKGAYHPGFYSRPNIGYTRYGKTEPGQYAKKKYNSLGKSIKNKDGNSVIVNKILDVYRKEIKPLKRERSSTNADTGSTRRRRTNRVPSRKLSS